MSAGKVDIGAFRTYPAGYTPAASTEESEYQSIPLNKIEDFGVHANQYYQLKVEIFKSSAEDKLLSLLWNKYWVSTLSQSPLIVNRSYTAGQVKDLAEKIARTTHKLGSKSGIAGQGANSQGASLDLRTDDRQNRRQMVGGQDGAAAGSSDSQGKALPAQATDAQSAQKSGKAPDRPDMHPKIQAAMQELAKRDAETPLSQVAKDAAKIASEAKAGLISQVMKDIVFNKSAAGLHMPPLS
jgi:COP9 signalosome complex subunit 5